MQILRSWWGMVLLAVIVACSGFLFYTLTVEESVDAVCTLIYEGKEDLQLYKAGYQMEWQIYVVR